MMHLVDRYEAFLLDLDGVLYRGLEVIPPAPAAIASLRTDGKGIVFVTNNSSRTPARVAERLRGMGIAAGAEEVVTSAGATAELLAGRGVSTAFVVGEEGVLEALARASIEVRGGEPGAVDAVVVGFDQRADYDKLRVASSLVMRGAAFIGTNPDPSFPAADGQTWPGAGALLAAIEVTTGVTPEVIGKPNAPLLRAARAKAGGGTPLVVGDRLDTDIAGAAALGWDSLLVLTGITRRSDLPGQAIRPTHVAEDLSVLMR